jgi:hypothetical protein
MKLYGISVLPFIVVRHKRHKYFETNSANTVDHHKSVTLFVLVLVLLVKDSSATKLKKSRSPYILKLLTPVSVGDFIIIFGLFRWLDQ